VAAVAAQIEEVHLTLSPAAISKFRTLKFFFELNIKII
jgi:hypothetical protein